MIAKIGTTLGLLALTALVLYMSAYVFSVPEGVMTVVRLGLVALMIAGIVLTWFGRWPLLLGVAVVMVGVFVVSVSGLVG
jgi:hypothetical protein